MKITIRISENSLSFSAPSQSASGHIDIENYPLRTGISVSANLRQALVDDRMTRFGAKEALVAVDTPILLLPIEEFDANEIAPLYHHSFRLQQSHKVVHCVLPNLNAVAVFAVDNDIANIVADQYEAFDYMPIMQPVWKFMHKRSFTGSRANLFVYLHDNNADVMSFRQNRFRFYNRFNAHHHKDTAFYILYVWKQLGLDTLHDNLHIIGTSNEYEDTIKELQQFLKNIRQMNIAADLGHPQDLTNADIPIDLQLLYAIGR